MVSLHVQDFRHGKHQKPMARSLEEPAAVLHHHSSKLPKRPHHELPMLPIMVKSVQHLICL